MAAGDAVIKGTEFKLSYNGASYVGYMPVGLELKSKVSNDDIVQDERGATVTHVLSNPRKTLSGEFLIKSTGQLIPPATGDYISMRAPDDAAARMYYVKSAEVTFGSGLARLRLDLVIEDSQADGAAIAPAAADYNLATHADVTFSVDLGGASSIVSVTNVTDAKALVVDTDYEFDAGTLTLVGVQHLQSYITTPGDIAVITVEFDVGAPVSVTITGIAGS